MINASDHFASDRIEKAPFPGPFRYLLTPRGTFSAIYAVLHTQPQPVDVPQSRHV
jgi:hypothetical protein